MRSHQVPYMCLAGHGGLVRTTDSQSKESGLESSSTVLKFQRFSSSLRCIHEYMSINSGGYVNE